MDFNLNWNFEEELLLYNLYIKINDNNGVIDINSEIKKLSNYLKKLGEEKGVGIEEKYRNITGIKMKLQNIEYLMTEGAKGLSSVSGMDRFVFVLFNTNLNNFYKELKPVKEKYEKYLSYESVSDSSNNEMAYQESSLINKFIGDKVDRYCKIFEKCENEQVIEIDNNSIDLCQTYEQEYNLVANEYSDIRVSDIGISLRLFNVFSRNNIETLEDVLKLNDNILKSFRNSGVKCIQELNNIINELKTARSFPNKINSFSNNLISVKVNAAHIRQAVGEMLSDNDMSFLRDNEENRDILLKYKRIIEILGTENCNYIYKHPIESIRISNSLQRFYTISEKGVQRKNDIENLISCFTLERISHKIHPYINAYTSHESNIDVLNKILDINSRLLDIKRLALEKMDSLWYKILYQFLEWCSFDIGLIIEDFFDNLFSKENIKTVIQSRSKGETLEVIGTKMNVTRERVRQIEASAQKKFEKWLNRNKIVSMIAAIRNGDDILTYEEVQAEIKLYSMELLYMLKKSENPNFSHDKRLNIFVVNPDLIMENAQIFIDSLPNEINKIELKKYMEKAEFELGIPEELINIVIEDQYTITGNRYHRSHLTLTSIYEIILAGSYPNGIKLDDESINEFREKIFAEFGDVKLASNRAISAAIANIGILCGRGKYISKKSMYITQELIDEIHEYIVSSEKMIFLTNTLFALFQDRLEEQGIYNKYYLQGILHEVFNNEFTFRRDYISKDKNITSVYENIISFIRKSKYPISRAEIINEYPGITDAVINLAVSGPSILNYFGHYLHSNWLDLEGEEIAAFEKEINSVIKDGEIHHAREIYDRLDVKCSSTLRRLGICLPFSLYSVIEYLYPDQYEMKRPYLAIRGTIIDKPIERLKEFIYSYEQIEINEISVFIKENNIMVYNMLDLINSCNDRYLLLNRNEIATMEYIGIDSTIAIIIENLIKMEFENSVCIPIASITCIHKFPKINVQWDEWLIYSILKKWSISLDVETTTNQFRLSIPVVGIKGSILEANLNNIQSSGLKATISIVDDLDNIDDLIADESIRFDW